MKKAATKPVAMENPKKRIRNPLPSYIWEQLSAAWKQEVEALQDSATGQEAFLAQFVAIAGAHVADSNFGVNDILQEMKTSRTQLHRKLKALTGHSALELIRVIKMQKALLLLRHTDLPVAKVARQVGFFSVSHFSHVFRKHFNFLPSAVKKKG